MLSPMLLTAAPAPFYDPAWCWQLKWDGIRCVARKQGTDIHLWSRHGREMTAQFPEVAAAIVTGVTADQAILDGDLVVVASDGRPGFYADRLAREVTSESTVARPACTEKTPLNAGGWCGNIE